MYCEFLDIYRQVLLFEILRFLCVDFNCIWVGVEDLKGFLFSLQIVNDCFLDELSSINLGFFFYIVEVVDNNWMFIVKCIMMVF